VSKPDQQYVVLACREMDRLRSVDEICSCVTLLQAAPYSLAVQATCWLLVASLSTQTLMHAEAAMQSQKNACVQLTAMPSPPLG
jgi:hypothetical protein